MLVKNGNRFENRKLEAYATNAGPSPIAVNKAKHSHSSRLIRLRSKTLRAMGLVSISFGW